MRRLTRLPRPLGGRAPSPIERDPVHALHSWRPHATWIEQHELPRHPLDDAGYLSIGCAPCTRKLSDDPGIGGIDDRGGRWAGLKKTECGLHLPGGGA